MSWFASAVATMVSSRTPKATSTAERPTVPTARRPPGMGTIDAAVMLTPDHGAGL